jgi:hypothetical protein
VVQDACARLVRLPWWTGGAWCGFRLVSEAGIGLQMAVRVLEVVNQWLVGLRRALDDGLVAVSAAAGRRSMVALVL